MAALNSAFEHFLNLSPRSPEYISLFMDDKLRKGLKVRAPLLSSARPTCAGRRAQLAVP